MGVSRRRFADGWEPKRTTTVTAWDEHGRPLRWVTETEAEFTEAERDDWYARWEYEQSLCPQCHGPRDECESPEGLHYPQRHVCWKTAAQQVATRRFHEKTAKAKPDPTGYLPGDGVLVWTSTDDLTPDDQFI